MDEYIWLWALGGVVGWVAVEFIKHLILAKQIGFNIRDRDTLYDIQTKINRRFEVGYGEKDRELINDVNDILRKTDESGRPLAYMSPEVERRQKHVLEEMSRLGQEVILIQGNQKEIMRLLHETVMAQKEITIVLSDLRDRYRDS